MRPPPLFLARRAYRLRRLTDAARLLPVVATFLFLACGMALDGWAGAWVFFLVPGIVASS